MYEAIVIGGGINGLATAAALVEREVGPIAVLEQFSLGHQRGSSHGPSRIIRSAYADSAYVQLMRHVRQEEWPRLERMLDRQLVFPTPCCFFGVGPEWRRYLDALLSQDVAVDQLDPTEGRRRFPQFHFSNAASVLDDRTAGVLAADVALSSLAAWNVAHGVELCEDTRVLQIDLGATSIRLETSAGEFRTSRLVLAAGAWAAQLLPRLQRRLTVIRQTIGYFRLDGAASPHSDGADFPVWVYVGEGLNEMFYGLPSFGREGVKIGRHRTVGAGDDPNEAAEPREQDLADLRRFLEEQLTMPVRDLAAAEHCLYTATANEDFILDVAAEDSRIVIGSACSGHGFKFAPWTGRVLADLAMDGCCLRPEFLAMKKRFALSGLRTP